MPPAIATVVCFVGIAGLFFLDRDRGLHTSTALWIPVCWLLLAGSRPLSSWLQAGSAASPANVGNVEANPLNVIVFSALLAAGLAVLVGRGPQVGRLLRTNWPVLLFFSYCALSTLWSDYPDAAFRKWVRSLGDPVMVMVVVTDCQPVAAFKRLLARAGFLLLPISVLLIKYYPILGRMYSNDSNLMYTGVTSHKNTLGMVCLVFGLGFVWRYLEHYRIKGDPHRGRHLLALGGILATVVWLLWMANSATSTSCFMMATAVIAVTSLSRAGRKLGVVHMLVVVLVTLPLFALFADAGGGLVESVGRNATLSGRTAIWQQVIGMAGNPLVGEGFESFWLGDRLTKFWDDHAGSWINQAHNGYLEIYLNLGWCGVIILVVLIMTGYRNVIVAFRQDRHLGGLKVAYFVAAVVYSFTEAGFRMICPIWSFFLLATTAVPRPCARTNPILDDQVIPPGCRVPDSEGCV